MPRQRISRRFLSALFAGMATIALALSAGASDDLDSLIARLENRDWQSRRDAATAIAALGEGGAPAIPALIDALDDQVEAVRTAVITALDNLGPAAVAALGDALRHGSPSGGGGWFGLQDLSVRIHVAEALGRLGIKGLPVLTEALWTEGQPARKSIVRALLPIGSEAVPVLIQALDDDDVEVRATAAQVLGEMDPDTTASAVPALTQVLSEDDQIAVRLAAANALTAIRRPDPATVSVLMEAATASHTPLKLAAIRALERFGAAAKPAATTLFRLLTDESSSHAVKEASADALIAIGPEPAEALPVLLPMVESGSRDEQLRGLKVLGAVGSGGVPVLVAALGDSEWRLRAAAAEAIGRAGAPAGIAVPDLVRGLQDRIRNVRIASARSLGEIGPPYALEAIPTLTLSLSDPFRRVRAAAAWALGRMGEAAASAEPALVGLLEDPFEEVQAEAREALAAIRGSDANDDAQKGDPVNA